MARSQSIVDPVLEHRTRTAKGRESMSHGHADNHDFDKLDRWLEDLAGDAFQNFPVCAVFLVSEEDGRVHDIFRQYRASFEARGSGFANLVIFGQHGVSTTVRQFRAEWGLSGEVLPTLVLLASAGQDAGYVLNLPAGAAPEVHPTDPQPWQEVLDRIEESDYDVLESRVSLSKAEKIGITAKTWLGSMLPLPSSLR